MKRQFISIVCGCFAGISGATIFYRVVDHMNHPQVYAAYSAPFYVHLIIPGIILVISLIGLIVIHGFNHGSN